MSAGRIALAIALLGSTAHARPGDPFGVGTAVAIGFFGSEAKVPPPAIAILATTAVFAGPIVGYHLSSDDKASEPVTLMLPLISSPF